MSQAVLRFAKIPKYAIKSQIKSHFVSFISICMSSNELQVPEQLNFLFFLKEGRNGLRSKHEMHLLIPMTVWLIKCKALSLKKMVI